MSNPRQQHAVIHAFASNQRLLSTVVVLILEKHVTQLAKLAFAQNLFLHSVIVMIPITSVIQNVVN